MPHTILQRFYNDSTQNSLKSILLLSIAPMKKEVA